MLEWDEADELADVDLVLTEKWTTVNALVMRHSVDAVMTGAIDLPRWETLMHEMLGE